MRRSGVGKDEYFLCVSLRIARVQLHSAGLGEKDEALVCLLDCFVANVPAEVSGVLIALLRAIG